MIDPTFTIAPSAADELARRVAEAKDNAERAQRKAADLGLVCNHLNAIANRHQSAWGMAIEAADRATEAAAAAERLAAQAMQAGNIGDWNVISNEIAKQLSMSKNRLDRAAFLATP